MNTRVRERPEGGMENAAALASQESASASTARVLRDNYLKFQYHSVQFIADHLADCSRVFKGDLHQMLILALIGQVALNARMRSPGAQEVGSISASRLSDVSGIPRETVRRKLSLLKERGWIEQIADGSWRLCASSEGGAVARTDLNELDERSIARWARLFCAVKPII